MTTMMETEITEIPALFKQNIALWLDAVAKAKIFLQNKPQLALVGRGSSYNAARFASYLYCQKTGLHPTELHPTAISLAANKKADWSHSVLWAYSASGHSKEAVNTAAWLRDNGATVIAITNGNHESPLGRVADLIIPLATGNEQAVPATKSFICQLAVTAALCGYDLEGQIPLLAAALEKLRHSLLIEDLTEFVIGGRVCVFLGYGSSMAAAHDGALKIQECAGAPAAAWSYEDFLHGPIGFITPGDPIVIFADEHGKIPGSLPQKLRTRQAATFVINAGVIKGPNLFAKGGNQGHIEIPDDSWMCSIVFAALAQQLACRLAVKLGHNPDAPVGLHKITLV